MIRKLGLVAGAALFGVLTALAIAAAVNLHGNIINADVGYQVGAAAPSGYTLVGNGSEYVPQAPSVTDAYNSFPGCAFASDGTHLNCTVNVTFATPLSSATYSILCSQTYDNTIEGGAWVDLGIGQFYTNKTAAGFTYNENSGNNSALSSQFGAAANYGLEVTCHASTLP